MARKKRGRKKGLRNQPFKLNLKKESLYSITSTIFLSLAALVILSFAQQGNLLISINQFLVKFFGWGAVFLPFLFISAGLMLTRLKWRLAKPNVFVGGLLLIFSLIGLSQAGLLGGQIWSGLAGMITGVGAIIILVGSAFVGFVVLFETSLEEMVLLAGNLFKFIKKNTNALLKTSGKGFVNGQKGQVQIKGLEPSNPMAPEPAQAKKPTRKPPLSPQLISNMTHQQITKWVNPPLSILSDSISKKADRGDLKNNAAVIEKTLESFGIEARVVEVNCGPAVTQYALEIALGTKLSKVTGLANDLALSLAAPTGQIRIEAPIPGRSLVGIEVPNQSLEVVGLKKMLTSEQMKKSKSKLTVGLGLDVSGTPIVIDIGRMPHVLIAGATGSGKSVCINSIIATLVFRNRPDEVKLILVDPKRVELTQYNGIPHLLTPVIIEPEQVLSALKWSIAEMERRYKLFADKGARNIEDYNTQAGFQKIPYIVIIIDELADIMLFAPSEVEDTITRIAQMARATGIHLVVSTQRPSVDVITGLIKANIPCRVAFNVSSMVDSRVILDFPGAEKLLGRGDMLYIPPTQAKPNRIQGAYVANGEIKQLIDFLKNNGVGPIYTEEVTTKYKAGTTRGGILSGGSKKTDDLFAESIRTVCQYDRASASLLQRRLSIGYARAARILDQLEQAGIVSPAEGSKPRDVLIQDADTFLAQQQEG